MEITVAHRQLIVNGEKLPLLSGEVHYWRLNPHNWERILDVVRELGVEIISSYVPWQYHEYERGKFDFEGTTDPQRNLAGFLELLNAKNLWAVIRPGPYIYSEWVNRGVPSYVVGYHRLHPKFLEAAERYIEAVCAVLKPHLATNGGRIILLQPDNELDPFVHCFSDQLGLEGGSGLFQEFLEERYGTVEALNHVWETDYDSFEAAWATTSADEKDKAEFKRYLDYRRFLHWFVNRAVGWMADKYRELGIDVPLYFNSYAGWDVQDWRAVHKVAEVEITGIDIYPAVEFQGGIWSHRRFMELARYTRICSKIPFIAEFETGIWHDWIYQVGVLTPNHYRLLALSALAAGIAGWNWYMLVNRDNWYLSPINEWGRKRNELFPVFQEIVDLYRRLQVPELRKRTETAISFSVLHHAAGSPGEAVLNALYDGDIDYEWFDTAAGEIDKRLLFYAGEDWLDREANERLRDYVESGGILICFNTYPRWDEEFEPLNRLAIQPPDGIVTVREVEVEVGGGRWERPGRRPDLLLRGRSWGTDLWATGPGAGFDGRG
ncbi:MAG: beta-galactosidase [Candidatus Bipolaricaulia bacterium]